MQIGFFAEGQGPHLVIAKYLVASAKKHMPNVPVFLLTDGETKFPGVEAIRIPEEMPMGVRRITHCSRLEGDWLFVDTDVIFRKSVEHVFKLAFDIALASRDGTYMAGTKYAEIMPYNTGVVFSKGPDFWNTLLPYLKKMPPEIQRWGGEQRLINEMVMMGPDAPWSVEILSSAYNFTPHHQDDDISGASIIHLKGPRKAWASELFPEGEYAPV